MGKAMFGSYLRFGLTICLLALASPVWAQDTKDTAAPDNTLLYIQIASGVLLVIGVAALVYLKVFKKKP
jgi:hypothetical protein